MRRTALRLMLPFLLLAQVMVGMSPGHAVCIALDACCGAHVHGEPAGFAFAGMAHHDQTHDHAHCHDGAIAHAHAHAHASLCPDDCMNECCAEHEECGGQPCDGKVCDGDCSEGSTHFHVALPDDGGCMRDRSNDHFCDLRLLAPALTVFAIQPVVDLHAQATPPPPWIWPDCDRATALKTDCLLI